MIRNFFGMKINASILWIARCCRKWARYHLPVSERQRLRYPHLILPDSVPKIMLLRRVQFHSQLVPRIRQVSNVPVL